MRNERVGREASQICVVIAIVVAACAGSARALGWSEPGADWSAALVVALAAGAALVAR